VGELRLGVTIGARPSRFGFPGRGGAIFSRRLYSPGIQAIDEWNELGEVGHCKSTKIADSLFRGYCHKPSPYRLGAGEIVEAVANHHDLFGGHALSRQYATQILCLASRSTQCSV